MREFSKRPRVAGYQRTGLVQALRRGEPWSKVRLSLEGIDPAHLDCTLMDWAHRKAGLPPVVPGVPAAPEPAPADIPEVPKAVPPKVRKTTK